MRTFRFLAVGLFLAALTAVPGVSGAAITHAAGKTTHFSSKICPYSIDYPTGWKVTRGKSQSQGDDFDSGPTVVSILCFKSNSNVTLKAVMNAEVASLKKKATVTNAKAKNGVARIDYNLGGAYAIIGLTISHNYVFHMQFVAESKKTFNSGQSAYYTMLNSIKFR